MQNFNFGCCFVRDVFSECHVSNNIVRMIICNYMQLVIWDRVNFFLHQRESILLIKTCLWLILNPSLIYADINFCLCMIYKFIHKIRCHAHVFLPWDCVYILTLAMRIAKSCPKLIFVRKKKKKKKRGKWWEITKFGWILIKR